MRAFGIDYQAFGLGDSVRLAPPPPRVTDGDFAQSGAQLLFVLMRSLRLIFLHRAMLADHPGGTPRACSATGFLRRGFSRSGSLSRLVSSPFIPPLISPATPGLLTDLQMQAHLPEVFALTEQPFALTKLADHLLGSMPVAMP